MENILNEIKEAERKKEKLEKETEKKKEEIIQKAKQDSLKLINDKETELDQEFNNEIDKKNKELERKKENIILKAEKESDELEKNIQKKKKINSAVDHIMEKFEKLLN